MEKLVQKYPGIDGLVLNAGVQKVISVSCSVVRRMLEGADLSVLIYVMGVLI